MAEFVGVDLHHQYCLIVRMDVQGEVLDRTRVATDATALHAYFDRPDPHRPDQRLCEREAQLARFAASRG